MNRTLDGSQPDWSYVAPIRAPEGAPNVLLVLTDYAGFGNPSGIGRRRGGGQGLGQGVKKSVAQIDGTSAKELKAGLAEAQAGMGG